MKPILANLRQLVFPREFRIAEPPWPDDWLETLRKLAELPPAPPPGPEDTERVRFLADLSTGIWRLRQKMVEPGTERPKEQFRREYRHLESVWDVLRQAGMEIQDHTGKPFDSGQALKVLAFQPTPGVRRERVQETVKPTIYYKGRHIQMGEVIVESPEKKDGASGPSPSSTPAEVARDSQQLDKE
jgi:hypothetical protein